MQVQYTQYTEKYKNAAHLQSLCHCHCTPTCKATVWEVKRDNVGEPFNGVTHQLTPLISNRTAVQRDVPQWPTSCDALQPHQSCYWSYDVTNRHRPHLFTCSNNV